MSKFEGLLKAVKEPPEEEPAAEPESRKRSAAPRRKAARKQAEPPVPEPAPAPAPAPAPRATRPMGRSRDPRYSKAMMYIPVDLHEETKRLLIGSGQNFSELCEELIQTWVDRTKK